MNSLALLNPRPLEKEFLATIVVKKGVGSVIFPFDDTAEETLGDDDQVDAIVQAAKILEFTFKKLPFLIQVTCLLVRNNLRRRLRRKI